MNTTQRGLIMQRWSVIQELMPELRSEVGPLTPRLERVIHTLEWVRIEDFVESTWCGVGRSPHDRGALASAFVAKAVLGLTTTEALIERLKADRALRRICGFSMWKRMPAPATFSRAFDEFAQAQLAQRVHEALVKEHLGQALIGHISRDGTATRGEREAGTQGEDPTGCPGEAWPSASGRGARAQAQDDCATTGPELDREAGCVTQGM